MNRTTATGRNVSNKESKTTFSFYTSDNRWHAWSNDPEHIDKMIGSLWELDNATAEGVSFNAPKHALQICIAEENKLTAKERRERIASLHRRQISMNISK